MPIVSGGLIFSDLATPLRMDGGLLEGVVQLIYGDLFSGVS